MAQQTVNIGTSPNDGTGDPARDAFDKVNDNFTELYAAAKTANANNGHDATLARQANTGVNVKMRDAKISYGATNFTGQFYADPVVAYGYNVDAQTGISDTSATDPWGNGIFFESDYAVDSGEGGTATSGTTTTQVTISGKTWDVNRFVNWTVYNVTRNASAQITANTATTLTHAAIAGQTTGDVIQILRRDLESYIQFNDQVGSYRGIRPFMYTMDKGSAEQHIAAKVISSATNAADAVFTTSTAHNLRVGSYVRFEGLTGGTWGTQLNNRSRRVKAVASTTTFSIENDSTGFGTLTAGNCYWEPDITSVFYGDRYNGFEVRAPTFRGNTAPSGQTYGDNMLFRSLSGQFDIAPGNLEDVFVNLLTGPNGTAYLTGQYKQLSAWQLLTNSASATATNVSLQVFTHTGGASAQSIGFFQRNAEAWGGVQIGAAGGITDALCVIDAALLPTTRPVHKIRQQASPTAAAHTHAVYANDNSTVQWFVDGLGNHVPRATAAAAADTNGFQYIPKISGAGVTGPTGTPANLTGNYANAVPMVASHNTSDNTYRISLYINGGWRTATLT